MEPNLLDCLLLHCIIVDEGQVKAVQDSSHKVEQLRQQLTKMRKKGKMQDFKETKDQLMKELRETDAIGVDLGVTAKVNGAIIKQVLGIYFDILKGNPNSPLMRGVFLGLPQFLQYINVELVWDLIGVLDSFLKDELKKGMKCNASNLITGLLASIQIVDVGVGQAFNVEEKGFMDTLYNALLLLVDPLHNLAFTDGLALLKALTIVFL